jgi:hypothetical protein
MLACLQMTAEVEDCQMARFDSGLNQTSSPKGIADLDHASTRQGRRGFNGLGGWNVKPRPNGAKRMECVELAPVFESPLAYGSASKLDALHTLRMAVHRLRLLATGAFASAGSLLFRITLRLGLRQGHRFVRGGTGRRGFLKEMIEDGQVGTGGKAGVLTGFALE